MKKISTIASVAAVALLAAACSESPSLSTAPDLTPSYAASANSATAGNKLQCFSGTTDTQENPGYGPYNGTCTLIRNGATLNTVDGDLDPNNAYAGVYILSSNLDGKLVGDINKLAFTYSGTGTTGGSPRITVPIDLNGDGSYDDFLSADAIGCTDGTATAGTVDVINNPNCIVSLNGGPSYPNFAAFVAANPTARVATDAISFVIVDQPGSFTITNVQLGKGPAKSKG